MRRVTQPGSPCCRAAQPPRPRGDLSGTPSLLLPLLLQPWTPSTQSLVLYLLTTPPGHPQIRLQPRPPHMPTHTHRFPALNFPSSSPNRFPSPGPQLVPGPATHEPETRRSSSFPLTPQPFAPDPESLCSLLDLDPRPHPCPPGLQPWFFLPGLLLQSSPTEASEASLVLSDILKTFLWRYTAYAGKPHKLQIPSKYTGVNSI